MGKGLSHKSIPFVEFWESQMLDNDILGRRKRVRATDARLKQ